MVRNRGLKRPDSRESKPAEGFPAAAGNLGKTMAMASSVTLEWGPPVSERRGRKGARAPAGLLPGMRVGLYWAGSVGCVRPAWLPPFF